MARGHGWRAPQQVIPSWDSPLQRVPWHAGQNLYLWLHRTYDTLFSVTEFSAGARPTQGKLEDQKMLTNPGNNINFYLRRHPKPTYNNWKRKHPTVNEKRENNFM